MAHQVIMPKQGLQMTEGYITAWKKKEGDHVSVGEPLFEMETDKLNIVIDAAVEGTLLKIVHPQGDTVPITEVIAYIGQAGEILGETPAPEGNEWGKATGVSGKRVFSTPRARMRAAEKGVDLQELTGSGPEGLVTERDVLGYVPVRKSPASPLAERIAALEGVQTAEVSGTGDRGKVMAADVRAFAKARGGPEEARDAGDSAVAMDGMRRGIASHMKASLDAQAQANHRMAVDMSACVRLRSRLKELGTAVSYTDIVVMAAARALREHPRVNVSREGDTIILKGRVSVGLAVATDKGLLVPVVAHADRRALSDIAQVTEDLAQRARSGQLRPDETAGGTFTVTNLGMYGIDSFTAICNAPESAILAVGAIKKQPVVTPEGTIEAREMMWLSLTYDHCVIDGAPAARFLKRIAQFLEDPALML